MKQADAQKLIEKVGGKDQAMDIVFGGLEPHENSFKWWDVEAKVFALVSISENSVYTPDLRKALTTLKLC